jgi:hypothetical protein
VAEAAEARWATDLLLGRDLARDKRSCTEPSQSSSRSWSIILAR